MALVDFSKMIASFYSVDSYPLVVFHIEGSRQNGVSQA